MIPDALNKNSELVTTYVFNPGRITNLAANSVVQRKFTNNQYDVLIVGWRGIAAGLTTGSEVVLFNVSNDRNVNWFENPYSFGTIFDDQPGSLTYLYSPNIHNLHVPYSLKVGESLTVTFYALSDGILYAEIAFWCIAFRQYQRLPVAIGDDRLSTL